MIMTSLTEKEDSPVRNDFLVFGTPAIEQPEIDEVVKCLKSGWKFKEIQKGLHEYKGKSYDLEIWILDLEK